MEKLNMGGNNLLLDNFLQLLQQRQKCTLSCTEFFTFSWKKRTVAMLRMNLKRPPLRGRLQKHGRAESGQQVFYVLKAA